MALQENAFFHYDGLYCEEERLELEESFTDDSVDDENVEVNRLKFSFFPLMEDEEDDELQCLLRKEEDALFSHSDSIDLPSLSVRADAVIWILKANSYHGFSALTAVLAVNYFDRFVSSYPIHADNPWMGQLTTVSCLSLAAKVEETEVPLLLDLQIKGSTSYLFEPKTIQRIELLILSTLQWKMNPVTPISFFDHLLGRFRLENLSPWEFRWRFERLLLSVIPESTFLFHLPSVITAGIMLYAVEEIQPHNAVEFQNSLMGVLQLSKEKVQDCHKFMLELSKIRVPNLKHKHPSTPGSPTGVIDVSFSSDSSNDSWAATSAEPPMKKSRIWEGHL